MKTATYLIGRSFTGNLALEYLLVDASADRRTNAYKNHCDEIVSAVRAIKTALRVGAVLKNCDGRDGVRIIMKDAKMAIDFAEAMKE